MEKVLITGGAGFVGTALIKKLIRKYKNITIVSIDNYSSGSKSNHVKSKKVTYLNKDTQKLVAKKFGSRDTKMDLADAFEPDVVFHFGIATSEFFCDKLLGILVKISYFLAFDMVAF
jgi:UDP-glucose 4-epimerase